ncbi:MAG TPA: glycosyl hydrolase, partial [Verrucomicrobiae bacterium]|nr:glycosyl hydrolase [Verrucomicrobiae bacterium]
MAAESFTAAPGAQTGRWQEDPYALKALGDLEYCTGLNRFVFHRYAMQPWTNRWPGMTMGQWGFHFDRTETWWNQGKAWIDYVSRAQFMLQQGRYVAEAAYFNGESAPSEMREGNPPLPAGYEFDAINSDVLMHHAKVKDGRLNLDGGASYAVLVLPPNDANLTPPLLGRIGDFIRAGLTVVGERPHYSPSLQDFPHCDAQVNSLAKKLWGKCDGDRIKENVVGKGRVTWGKPLTDVFTELNLPPDFEFQGHDADSKIIYCHRQTGDAEIYFVSNQRQQFDLAECSFRITGKTPELWNAETGDIQTAPVWREENGRTIVPVQFDPSGSIFVVFRDKSQAAHLVSVKHQKTGFAGKPKHVELRIVKATYGFFPPSGQSWTDVTKKVQALVAKGTLEIAANNDFAGDDPAPNVPKQLRVGFSVNGQPQSEVAKENDTLALPPDAVVTNAVYGKLAVKNQTMDLTKKLALLVADGQLNVRADSALAGRDPANEVPKELRVEYMLNGVAKHITVQ